MVSIRNIINRQRMNDFIHFINESNIEQVKAAINSNAGAAHVKAALLPNIPELA